MEASKSFIKTSNRVEDSALKRQILDTSRKLLVQKGYASLSMRKIAAEIGYSATSIYLHYKNKDALFHALIDEGMNLLLEKQTGIAEACKEGAVARLEKLCRGYIDFGLEKPEYYEIMFLQRPKISDRFPIEFFRRARRNLDLVKDTIGAGVKDGIMFVNNIDAQTHVIWASLHGAISILLALRLDVKMDQASFIDNVIEHVVDSVTRNGLNPAV